MANLVIYLLGGANLFQAVAGNPNTPPPLVPRTWNGRLYGCKCYPGDACWPSTNEWNKLNNTVNGNLHVLVPPEAACHNTFNGLLGTIPTYDAAKCAEVTANYTREQWINDQDATLMWRFFSNSSCLPTTDPATSCTPGYYGTYVIRAKTKQHIKAGLDFARRNNLRLTVRNTGHDFAGRSNGWGALVINTHSFQDVKFHKKWNAPGPGGYSGPAVTIGAGVQGRALLRQAVAQNPPVTVVVGECPTVGVAGGFVQGGGHGPLTTIFGLAADNALSFDVLTADGKFVTANNNKNVDLFYGLKGGGPGNYGIVLSVTVKTFAERPSAGAEMYINATLTTNSTLFWEGVRIFHSHANRFVDNDLYVYFTVGPGSLRVRPFVAFNKKAAQLDAILTPLLAELTAAGVPFWTRPARQYATLFDLYLDLFEDEMAGPPNLTSGWVINRDDITTNNDGIIKAFKTAISPRTDLENMGYMVGHLFGAGHNPQPVDISATNPRFRTASNLMLYLIPVGTEASVAQKADLHNVLQNTVDKAFQEASLNGCAYVNEADPFMVDWQNHFWGPTVYPTLKKLKMAWDPNGVFYSPSLPGTEGWEVIEYGERLCKKL
ncbi:6-hydroxy-D-nicotine oxidase [Madurella mycetomatis]|uniref:6-hydroxy-D-nicotine oxidase n=1 Tax=Madurella mycetomatis TaxID=100816 RepID=A0A175VNS4_9PEZI|nr:6-hydroxy-D-nicotine oxidase [Madurella mycetomatis]